MTKTRKFVLATIFAAVIVPTLLTGNWVIRIRSYRNGFSEVELGQSKAVVFDLMGEPSDIRACNFQIHNKNKNLNADCFELNTYQGFYEKWAIAFDANGEVIEKYNWFLGEYGNRPPKDLLK